VIERVLLIGTQFSILYTLRDSNMFPGARERVLKKDHTSSVSEYVPAGHGVQIEAAEEVAPVWPYLPTAHKEPEHVKAPVICTYIYINIRIYIHVLYIVTHRRILCMF
jgi:hypothetical protein